MSDTQQQKYIVMQLQQKLNDKERVERDYKTAQDKLNRNSADSNAARDLQRASEQLERIENDIERLKNQL